MGNSGFEPVHEFLNLFESATAELPLGATQVRYERSIIRRHLAKSRRRDAGSGEKHFHPVEKLFVSSSVHGDNTS